MNSKKFIVIVCFSTIILLVAGWLWSVNRTNFETDENPFIEKPESQAERAKETNDRMKYLFRLLRDPATNSIPVNVRLRELRFAHSMIHNANFSNRALFATSGSSSAYNWTAAGPADLGGRTRAIAIDVSNPNTVLAGGVSGGVWKTTDNGTTWTLTNSPTQNLSVSYIAQDTRPGHTNVWYYCSGEIDGNSASDANYESLFSGTGIYKSTDNGDSWQVLPSTQVTNVTKYHSIFQYVSRIVVSPATGSIFISPLNGGIYRSSDGGTTWAQALGKVNDHFFNTIAVGSNGDLIAVMSEVHAGSVTPTTTPGVYFSHDDGVTWKNYTPGNFPTTYERSVVAFAPSDPSIAYVYTMVQPGGKTTPDSVAFFKFKFNSTGSDTVSTDDRTANLPKFGGQVGDISQGNYNMVVAVSPTDTNLVLLGSTNLYRTFDGFATPANNKIVNWIGGYSSKNDISVYVNNHPDQHIIAWNTANSADVWDGHDGGLSYTPDITDTTTGVSWINKNNGYVVSQFYAISLRNKAGDNNLLGGAQDNGSPFFQFGSTSNSSQDISSGDGGYAYLGDKYAYASVQYGGIFKYDYTVAGDNINYLGEITPPNAKNQIFVNPYAVDPDSESVMYYTAGDSLWRNTKIEGTSPTTNWQLVSGVTAKPVGSTTDYTFSAISVSQTPANIVYLGASDAGSSPTGKPLLYKMTSSTTATTAKDISSSSFPQGAWLNCIAVNPFNADEILVAFSNYNISSLFYSKDGGKTFTSVGGNLDGGGSGLGPSVRSALIVPKTDGTYYLVGTSTGLYSTTVLDSTKTSWTQESDQLIGNTVVDWLASRSVDERIAVATHGRGVFVGESTGALPVPPAPVPTAYKLYQNYPNPFTGQTTFKIDLPKAATISMSIYNVGGQMVYKIWDNKHYAPGTYSYSFQPRMLASGIYLYHLNVHYDAGSSTIETKKFTYVK